MRYCSLLLLLLLYVPVRSRGQAGNGTRQQVCRIDISGNRVTRRSVILREINVHEGDMVLKDSIAALIEENRLRLFNLQLFNVVEQSVGEDSAGCVVWRIHVAERWYVIPTGIVQFADRNINTWWVEQDHDLRRVSAGLTVTDKNFRGDLELLAVTVQAGYTQKLGINYIRPYANAGQTRGIGFFANVAQSRQTYYTTAADKLQFAGGYSGPVILRQAEGGISYIYRPAYANRHIFQVSYKQYEVGDTVVRLNPDYYADNSTRARFFEGSYRYEHNGVDNWNYSLRGIKLVTNAVVRAGLEGIRFQSFVNVEAGYFRNLYSRWYGAVIVRGRLMAPQGQPYYFRNGLGSQTDYVRGYEYYVTDGYQYGLLRLDLKRELFNHTYPLQVRYLTAIPLRIYPKVFFDAGYINGATAGRNTLNDQLLYSIGAGVDIVTAYDVKIRIEVARNHLGQNGVYLHFNSE